MKKILSAIKTFFKNAFGNGINVKLENKNKYNIKKNKKCEINITESGVGNEKK